MATAPSTKAIYNEIFHPQGDSRKATPNPHLALGVLNIDRGKPLICPLTYLDPQLHYYVIQAVKNAYNHSNARALTETKQVDWPNWAPIYMDVKHWFMEGSTQNSVVTFSAPTVKYAMGINVFPRNAQYTDLKEQTPQLPDEIVASIMASMLSFCQRYVPKAKTESFSHTQRGFSRMVIYSYSTLAAETWPITPSLSTSP
jgi:hypothetical protein